MHGLTLPGADAFESGWEKRGKDFTYVCTFILSFTVRVRVVVLMYVRGQPVRVGSLLPPCGSQRLNPGLQAPWQTPCRVSNPGDRL